METGRALQDVLKVHCFGCGSLNEQGLQIKSHWQGDELVCHWQPLPHHIGHPGIVYGGTIASPPHRDSRRFAVLERVD